MNTYDLQNFTSFRIPGFTICMLPITTTAYLDEGAFMVIQSNKGAGDLKISCVFRIKVQKTTLNTLFTLDNKARFVWGLIETHSESILANYSSSYKVNDSRNILVNLNNVYKLKIKSYFDVSEYHIQPLKPSIKSHLQKSL